MLVEIYVWGRRRYNFLFEGVCETTVILAPGACGRGLRAALLATTSLATVAPVAPAAPVAVFQKAPICCHLQYLSACGLPQTSPGPSAAQEGLQEPWEGLGEPIFDEISKICPEFIFWGPKVCIYKLVRRPIPQAKISCVGVQNDEFGV